PHPPGSPPFPYTTLFRSQDKQFERVGETRTRVSDVRIVAATNRDLDAAIRQGQFREDLLFRLNVIEVTVPPLRDRRDEILPLARSEEHTSELQSRSDLVC